MVRRLAYDENIAKCLLCNKPNFLDYELNEEEVDGLIFSSVYPCDFTLNLQNEAKSYITMRFKYVKPKNSNAFKIGYIAFKIFCHQSLIKTDYARLRYDYLLEQVDRLMNDTRGDGWLGKMNWEGMEDITVDSEKKYVGVQVIYRSVDFM